MEMEMEMGQILGSVPSRAALCLQMRPNLSSTMARRQLFSSRLDKNKENSSFPMKKRVDKLAQSR